MDFAGPAPIGAFAPHAAEAPLRKPLEVKQVTPGDQSGKTGTDKRGERDNSAQSEAARDITALRQEMQRRDMHAGPPPTFEISQLEIEADIRAVIARVEAQRTQARAADAVKTDAETRTEGNAATQQPAPGLVSGGAAGLATGGAASPATGGASSPATGGAARLAAFGVAGPATGDAAGPATGGAAGLATGGAADGAAGLATRDNAA